MSYTYGIKYYLANSFNYCCYIIIIKVLLLTSQFQINLGVKKYSNSNKCDAAL